MNIYQIKQEFLSIFDELEENGGELTDELEKQLAITQESFKDKIEAYTNVIKLLNSDIDNIKVEQKRLKDFADRKQKVIDRLKSVVIDAIEEFGDTKKSGVKYVDYGTGEVSIRRTKSVDVDKAIVDEIAKAVELVAYDARSTNQLDVADRLNPDTIIQFVATETKDDDDNVIGGYIVNEDDLRHTNIELSVKVPLADLIDGKAYPIIREMAKNSVNFNAVASVPKSDIKKELEENGSCAPNIARLVENKSISIK